VADRLRCRLLTDCDRPSSPCRSGFSRDTHCADFPLPASAGRGCRRHRIGPYFADFVCLQARLVIELDGSQHAERVEYDLARSRFLEQQDFRVLRYWNDAVFLRLDEVLAEIAGALDACIRPSSALRAPSPRLRGEGNETAQ
jgi:hypothetical protein